VALAVLQDEAVFGGIGYRLPSLQTLASLSAAYMTMWGWGRVHFSCIPHLRVFTNYPLAHSSYKLIAAD